MSKNLIEYSKNLFDIVVKDAQLPTKDKMKVAKNINKHALLKEISDFNGITVDNINYVLPNIKVAGISLREKQYILITGITDKLSNTELALLEDHGITLLEPHAGHLLALVKDANLSRNENYSSKFFEEYIFSQQDDVSYKCHFSEPFTHLSP